MLAPLTPESTWLGSLREIPNWQPPLRATVVVAPHPDDETLGAGGLIASQRRRGITVRVVAVTDGEAAYADSPRLGEIREEEQQAALWELGVPDSDIIRLHLPDSNVSTHLEELVDLLMPLVDSDTLLVAPWLSDPHPDHEASGQAAREVAARSGVPLVSYFFWSWHRSKVESLTTLPLVQFALDPTLQAAKAFALTHYQSQLHHESGSPILPDLFLSPVRRTFETFIFHG